MHKKLKIKSVDKKNKEALVNKQFSMIANARPKKVNNF